MKTQSINFYKLNKSDYFKFFALLSASFLLAFIVHFPLGNIIESNIRSVLKNNPECPVLFDELNASYFPPGYQIPYLKIPRRCIDTNAAPNEEISLSNTLLAFSGLSFSPFGPALTLETNLFNNAIVLDAAMGLGGNLIKLEDVSLNLESLFTGLEKEKYATGDILTNLLLESSGQEIQDFKLTMKSSNLNISSQNLMGMLQIPSIPVKDLFVKLKKGTKKGNIEVEQFVLGNEQSPLRAKVTGEIAPKLENIRFSGLNLKAELYISEELKSKFSILEMMLSKFNQENNFYQINIRGTLATPKLN